MTSSIERAEGPLPRVMQVMAGARFGGAEEMFVRLTTALADAGLPQRAAIRRHPDRARRLREHGVATVELPFGGPLDLLTPLVLAREVRAFRPAVVMTWMSRASRMLPRGDFVHVGRNGGYYPAKYFRKCRDVVVISHDLARFAREGGWPPERIHLIQNFPDDEPVAPASRAAENTPEDAPLLLGVGRLHAAKGFDVLLRALAELPAAHLWIAGEGPARGELEAETRRLGLDERVRLLGWRTDVPALMRAADVFVCSSRHEPLGSIMFEAWAHDTPMVAAASQGPGETIVDGTDGLLVPIDDAPALAGAVRRLLEDPALARRLADAGRRRFETDFSRPVIVGRYLDLYRRLAAEHARTSTQASGAPCAA